MTRKGHFCPHCGQKAFDGRIRMKELFSKFFHNITHLDGQFIRMVWNLLIPGKVTTDYFKGKIKQYPHPVQFFFVVMFFFLLMVHKMAENQGKGFRITINNSTSSAPKKVVSDDLLDKYATGLELLSDYKQLPDSLKSPQAERAVQSLATGLSDGLDTLIGMGFRDTTVMDTMPVTFGGHEIKLSVVDIAKMPYEDILTTYSVDSWKDKILVTQFVKSIRDSKMLANSIISSLTWTILVMSAFMAWILYLLFRKRRSYYVEHFVFMLHFFSGVFLLLTLAFAVHLFAFPLRALAWTILVMAIEAGFFMSIRRFYTASVGKVILTWFLFNFIGLIAFALIFAMGMMVVFILF